MTIYRVRNSNGSLSGTYVVSEPPVDHVDGSFTLAGLMPHRIAGVDEIDSIMEVDGEEFQADTIRFPPGSSYERIPDEHEFPAEPENT